MSQRVQKGSTVFRPVARPRARPATESRQPSVLPEEISVSGPSRTQDNVGPRAASAMPPPTILPQKRESLNPQHVPLLVHASSTVAPQQAIRNTSRMPPTIGSSQPFSSHTIRPTTTVQYPHVPHALPYHSPIVPPIHTSAPLEPGPSNPLNNFRTIPQHSPAMNPQPSVMRFSVDPSQIDPQLVGAAGPTHAGPQGLPLHGHSLDNVPPIPVNDAPINNTTKSRRSSRKHPEASGAVSNPDATLHNDASDAAPSKRRRSKKTNVEGDENTSEPATKKRRLSGSESRPGRARTRPPSPPPFDPDVDPGEELDPTAVTMAALCDDTGRGRVSSRAAQIVSNHAAWRASNREKRARMKAVMEAKKYGRNLDEEEERAARTAADTQAGESGKTADSGSASRAETPAGNHGASGSGSDRDDEEGDKSVNGFNYAENLAVSRYHVQVRIGANGETIIDEESLFVNRDEEHRTEDYTHVEESDFTKFVNSGTYSRKVRGSRWSVEETELFFDALSQFGENYELISYILPGRDRKACKNKFKAEDKKNPARITYCLNNRKPYDIQTLTRMTGKDFSGPTPEIRVPTPVRSEELQADEPDRPSPRAVRKKSRTPRVRDADVEIVGDIDEVEKEDHLNVDT